MAEWMILAGCTCLLCIVAIFVWKYLRRPVSRDLEIAVLGPTYAGKTLFLCALMEQLTQSAKLHEVLAGGYLSDDEELKLRNLNSFLQDSLTGYAQPFQRSTYQLVDTELVKRYRRDKSGSGTTEPEHFYLDVWGIQYLFDIDSKYLQNLASLSVSEELRQEFHKHGRALSSRLTVREKEEHRKWLLFDRRRRSQYFIRKEDDGLHVYSIYSPQRFVWRDIPGSYFEDQTRWSRNAVEKSLNNSAGIFLLIDASLLFKHYLFGMETTTSTLECLDQGKISQELQQLFGLNQHPLSERAKALPTQRAMEWLLQDGEKYYTILKGSGSSSLVYWVEKHHFLEIPQAKRFLDSLAKDEIPTILSEFFAGRQHALLPNATLLQIQPQSEWLLENGEKYYTLLLESGTDTLIVYALENSLRYQNNYLQAIKQRLVVAQKRKETFPVWLVFTKGDRLWTPLQKMATKILKQKTSQLTARLNLAPESKPLESLVSVNPDAPIYDNIGDGIKKFFAVLSQESSKKEVNRQSSLGWAWMLLGLLGLVIAVLAVETCAAYRFYRVSSLQAGEMAQLATATQAVERMCSYAETPWQSLGTLWRKRRVQEELGTRAQNLYELGEESLQGFNVAGQELLWDGKSYREKLQELADMATALRHVGRILPKQTYETLSNQVKQLVQWSALDKGTEGEDENLISRQTRFFREQLPPGKIKDTIGMSLHDKLRSLLEKAQNRAEEITAAKFYPGRLEPLNLWYYRFHDTFAELDKKCQKYQDKHWEYCWEVRYRSDFEKKVEPQLQANILFEFRDILEEIREKFPRLPCPPGIEEGWHNVTTDFLKKYPQYARNFEKFLSKAANLQTQCLLFEQKIKTDLREALKQEHKKQGLELIAASAEEIKNFLEKYQPQGLPEPFYKDWNERYLYLKNKFASPVTLPLLLKKYSCDKEPPTHSWREGWWFDSCHLYMRIEVEGQEALVLQDIGNGELVWNGTKELTISWQPWLPIVVKFMEADGDIDGQQVTNDDLLSTVKFVQGLSVIALATGEISHKENDCTYSFKFERKVVPQDDPIPQWLLNIYEAEK